MPAAVKHRLNWLREQWTLQQRPQWGPSDQKDLFKNTGTFFTQWRLRLRFESMLL